MKYSDILSGSGASGRQWGGNALHHSLQAGVSLVEIMIALTLGLIITTAISGVFATSNQARNETQKTTQQQESGRYATQLLGDNLTLAGYLAEFAPPAPPLFAPVVAPDPCVTDIDDLLTAMALHVQGIDNGAVIPACLGDVKAGTDIIVIRRVSTCVAGAADCEAYADGPPHLQASLCSPTDNSGAELAHAVTNEADYAEHYFRLSNTAADFTLRSTDCATAANIQRYLVQIYFVANNNAGSDGIPTLKRAQLGDGAFTITPLVDGIEDMQIEYGIDTDGNGAPDTYSSAPVDADWVNVMAARIHLLTRNTQVTTNYSNTRSYTLGREADNSDKVLGPFNDGFKRHVYTSTTNMINPSGRRQ